MTPQELFTLLSDQTRLRCLVLLNKKTELCVCELGYLLDASQPKVSRHLASLRQSGLVSDRRQEQWIYYRLCSDLPVWIEQILTTTVYNVLTMEPYCSDLEKIEALQSKQLCTLKKE